MTDEAYTLAQTNRDRAITKRSANKVPHNKRPSKVVMPSDLLSNKEKRKLNGPVISYNLKRPMSWESFKNMPKHAQTQYLTNLRDEYGASNLVLATELFGISPSGFATYIDNHDLPKLGIGKRLALQQKQWDAFLHGEPEAPAKEEQPECPVSMDTSYVSVRVSGDLAETMEKLIAIYRPLFTEQVNIQISISKKESTTHD